MIERIGDFTLTDYEKLIQHHMSNICPDYPKYSPIGKVYYENKKHYEGYYWFYETDNFVVDISDFFIKKDFIETDSHYFKQHILLVNNYIISGSGEWLNPYETIEPFSMFIMDTTSPFKRYLLHGNSRFLGVGIKFKQKMVEDYIKKTGEEDFNISTIFFGTQNYMTQPISKLSKEIIDCRLTGEEAKLFFEEKADEWLSIAIDAYKEHQDRKELSFEDQNGIENVARYIEDHYPFDIPQDLLENIAAMGGTKLKETFKKVYHMSITEFTQRKRMNIAENLLLTTDFDSKDIAEAIGYNSASRFSTLFKRYKGISPTEFRNQKKEVSIKTPFT